MRRAALIVLAFSAIGLLAFRSVSDTSGEPTRTISKDGVSIKVYDFEGLNSIFKQDNDTTYVINFWATWCKPCVKEMPHFESFAKEMADKKFKLIFVSLDFPSVYERALIPFLKAKGIDSECVVLDDADANSWISKVDESWTGAIPATVIYRGDDRLFHEGYMEESKLKIEVHKRINNPN